MSLTASVYIRITSAFTNALDQQTVSGPLEYSKTYSLTDGTGANKAQQLFTDDRVLGAAANEELDLAGVLLNAFGLAVTFTKVKVLLVHAAAANTNNVLVFGAAANGFNTPVSAVGDEIVLRPDGCMLLMAPGATGYAVTAGTGDLLRFENSAGGTGVTYTLVILGEGSAA